MLQHKTIADSIRRLHNDHNDPQDSGLTWVSRCYHISDTNANSVLCFLISS